MGLKKQTVTIMKAIITLLFAAMSYFNMYANITIGEYEFLHPNSFEITQSVEQISDSAKIVLARNYKEIANKKILDVIAAGMPVTISTGYNGNLQQEFTGFIKPGIGTEFPVELECDALYFLRQNNFNISERQITLKKLLERIAPGYIIETLDTNLGKVHFSNRSTFQILEQLKKDWGFYSRINGNILHVGFAFDYRPSFTKTHDYTIGENVRDSKKLKFSTDIDYNTEVKIILRKPNGKKEEIVWGMRNINGTMKPVRIGDKEDKSREKGAASVKSYDVSHIDTKEAERIAKAQLQKIIYSGYSGSISGFCEPRTNAGDNLRIINRAKPDREGTYLIEKVKLSYDEAKIERENFISYKVA